MVKNYQPKLVPDIEIKIQKQLKKLGLKALTPVSQFLPREHTYYSICVDKKDRKYFFKARLWAEKITQASFANEILFYRKFNKSRLFRRRNILIKVLDSSLSGDLNWILSEYIDGQILSQKQLSLTYLKKIAEILGFFRQIPEAQIPPQIKNYQKKRLSILLKNYHPKKNKFERYLEETLKRFFKYRKELPNYNQIEKNIYESREVINKAPEIFCHGDFNISNMIEKKSGQIVIVDWESVQKNNWAYDLANCYTHEKFQPYRQSLLKIYLKSLPVEKRALFLKSFRLMVFLQIGYKLFPALAPVLERQKIPARMFTFWKKILAEVFREDK